MICPKCGNNLGRVRRYCEQCGADAELLWRLIYHSNRLYNEGLEKAKVRDLSGAEKSLKESLKYNKFNIDARNLLGLVLLEMGEVVEALGQWIISSNYSTQNNPAEYYLGKVRDNSAKLDAVNQSVKKYNLALNAIRQENYDLAILQLRKVVGARPNYLRALSLLCLLYLRSGEYEKAKKCAVQGLKTDIANTMLLRYLAEAESNLNGAGKDKKEENEKLESSQYNIAPTGTPYKEEKPNVLPFLTFFGGILIGIAVLYVLVVPTVRNNVRTEFESRERNYNTEISSYTTQISLLENDKEDLNDKLAKTEKSLEKLKKEMDEQEFFDAAAYEKLMLALSEYSPLREKITAAQDDDKKKIEVLDETIPYVEKLLEVRDTAMARQKTQALFNQTFDEVAAFVKKEGYNRGKELYNASKFAEATTYLLAAYRAGKNDVDEIYFLGRAYQKAKDFEHAKEYLNLVVDMYPGTDRAGMAKQSLSEIK